MTTDEWARNAASMYRCTGQAESFVVTPAAGGPTTTYVDCKAFTPSTGAMGFADLSTEEWLRAKSVMVPRLQGAPRPVEGDTALLGARVPFVIGGVWDRTGTWEVLSLARDGAAVFTLPAFTLSTGDPLVAPVVVVDGVHPVGATSVLTRNAGTGTLSGEAVEGSGVDLDGTLYTIGEKSRASQGVLTLKLVSALTAELPDGSAVDSTPQSITVLHTFALASSSFYTAKRPESEATMISGFEFRSNDIATRPTGAWSCAYGGDSGQVIDTDYSEGMISVWLGRRLLQR